MIYVLGSCYCKVIVNVVYRLLRFVQLFSVGRMKIRVILHQQRCAVRDALHVHADLYALGLYSIDVVVQ